MKNNSPTGNMKAEQKTTKERLKGNSVMHIDVLFGVARVLETEPPKTVHDMNLITATE